MRFDDSGLTKPALNDIWVDCSLHEEIHCANLTRRFLKDADKLLSDDLAFRFGICYVLEFYIEAVARVDADKVDIVSTGCSKNSFDLIPLVLA